MKPWHLLLIVGIVVLLSFGGWYLAKQNSAGALSDNAPLINNAPVEQQAQANEPASSSAVEPMDQKPAGMMKVSSAALSQAGFVTIYADAGGAPGELIGATSLMDPGTHEGVDVPLARDAVDGETLYVKVLVDSDRNLEFDEAMDKPAVGANGQPVMASFTISMGAAAPYE